MSQNRVILSLIEISGDIEQVIACIHSVIASEARQSRKFGVMDRHVAALLAMTEGLSRDDELLKESVL